MKGVTQEKSGAMFKIGRTRGQNSGINPTPVPHKGTKEETVKRFLEANPEILSDMGRVGAVTEAFGLVGDKWAEAWKAVEPQLDHDLKKTSGHAPPKGVTCPCCGETFDYLPQHLPCNG